MMPEITIEQLHEQLRIVNDLTRQPADQRAAMEKFDDLLDRSPWRYASDVPPELRIAYRQAIKP